MHGVIDAATTLLLAHLDSLLGHEVEEVQLMDSSGIEKLILHVIFQ